MSLLRKHSISHRFRRKNKVKIEFLRFFEYKMQFKLFTIRNVIIPKEALFDFLEMFVRDVSAVLIVY